MAEARLIEELSSLRRQVHETLAENGKSLTQSKGANGGALRLGAARMNGDGRMATLVQDSLHDHGPSVHNDCVFFCGKRVGSKNYQDFCGFCDGVCGPNNGCVCKACYKLTVASFESIKAGVSASSQRSQRIRAGDIVERGPAWHWGDQDELDGFHCQGLVTKIDSDGDAVVAWHRDVADPSTAFGTFCYPCRREDPHIVKAAAVGGVCGGHTLGVNTGLCRKCGMYGPSKQSSNIWCLDCNLCACCIAQGKSCLALTREIPGLPHDVKVPSRVHSHPLVKTLRRGWGCDGRQTSGGCRSGGDGTGFHNNYSWYCSDCDFDLCISCTIEHSGIALTERILCEELHAHALIKVKCPYNGGLYSCNAGHDLHDCKSGDSNGGGFEGYTWHCSSCNYDLCAHCALAASGMTSKFPKTAHPTGHSVVPCGSAVMDSHCPLCSIKMGESDTGDYFCRDCLRCAVCCAKHAGCPGEESGEEMSEADLYPEKLRVGDVVVRGVNWEWDDQDEHNGRRCAGRVTEVMEDDGCVKVAWFADFHDSRAVSSNLYRYSATTHDVKLAELREERLSGGRRPSLEFDDDDFDMERGEEDDDERREIEPDDVRLNRVILRIKQLGLEELAEFLCAGDAATTMKVKNSKLFLALLQETVVFYTCLRQFLDSHFKTVIGERDLRSYMCDPEDELEQLAQLEAFMLRVEEKMSRCRQEQSDRTSLLLRYRKEAFEDLLASFKYKIVGISEELVDPEQLAEFMNEVKLKNAEDLFKQLGVLIDGLEESVNLLFDIFGYDELDRGQRRELLDFMNECSTILDEFKENCRSARMDNMEAYLTQAEMESMEDVSDKKPNSAAHRHYMQCITTIPGNWGCDGRHFVRGCLRGCSDLVGPGQIYQSVHQYRCFQCNFDLCDYCFDAYKIPEDAVLEGTPLGRSIRSAARDGDASTLRQLLTQCPRKAPVLNETAGGMDIVSSCRSHPSLMDIVSSDNTECHFLNAPALFYCLWSASQSLSEPLNPHPHTGVMTCACAHKMGKCTYPIQDYHSSACKWNCCDATWDTAECCESKKGRRFSVATRRSSVALGRLSQRANKFLPDHKECLKLLLKHGASVDFEHFLTGERAVHLAVEVESAPCLEILIEYGAEINAADVNENTPLHIASATGSAECVEMLIKAGALLNEINREFQTPLDVTSDSAVYELLEQAGGKPSEAAGAIDLEGFFGAVAGQVDDGEAPADTIRQMLQKSDEKTRKMLVTCKVPEGSEFPDAEMGDYFTAGALASRLGLLDSLQVLLMFGADPNATDSNGNTCVHYACMALSLDCLEALIKRGGDVNACNHDGLTPLLVTMDKSADDLFDALIEAGADTNLLDKHGASPAFVALRKKKYKYFARLLDKDASLHCPKGEKNILVQYLTKQGQSPKLDYVVKIVTHDIRFYRDPEAHEADHDYSWTTILNTTVVKKELSLRVAAVILDQNQDIIQRLANATDEDGRAAINIASHEVRMLMQKYLYFMGTYEILDGPPVHQSETAKVFFAIDHTAGAKLEPRVALKFMQNAEQFQRELIARRTGDFSPSFVVGVLEYYDNSNARYMEDLARLKLSDYPFCLVMPAASRSLKEIVDKEHIAKRDWFKIRDIMTKLAKACGHLHDRGFIHGDIKPLNIVRVGENIKLIDLDACVSIDEFGAAKWSSAYIAPELLYLDTDRNVKVRDPSALAKSTSVEKPVKASVSQDLWSLGCVLFQLCTGETLWQANDEDNLDQEHLQLLFLWDTPLKQKKLEKVVSAKESDKARNLISQLLNRDPAFRPHSVLHMLEHPFFTNKTVGRCAGERAEFDVFLSYRVDSDLAIVDRLYKSLKSRGLKVWWDRQCLRDGERWEDGFISGLIKSKIFVPVISRGGQKSKFELLRADSRIDNVLLEHRFALELTARGLIEYIFPIMVGDYDEASGLYSDYFKSGCYPEFSGDAGACVVLSVEDKLFKHLDSQGLGSPINQDQTVSRIFDGIKARQGGFVSGQEAAALETLAGRIQNISREQSSGSNNDAMTTRSSIINSDLMAKTARIAQLEVENTQMKTLLAVLQSRIEQPRVSLKGGGQEESGERLPVNVLRSAPIMHNVPPPLANATFAPRRVIRVTTASNPVRLVQPSSPMTSRNHGQQGMSMIHRRSFFAGHPLHPAVSPSQHPVSPSAAGLRNVPMELRRFAPS